MTTICNILMNLIVLETKVAEDSSCLKILNAKYLFSCVSKYVKYVLYFNYSCWLVCWSVCHNFLHFHVPIGALVFSCLTLRYLHSHHHRHRQQTHHLWLFLCRLVRPIPPLQHSCGLLSPLPNLLYCQAIEEDQIFFHLLKFVMNTLPSLENNREVSQHLLVEVRHLTRGAKMLIPSLFFLFKTGLLG